MAGAALLGVLFLAVGVRFALRRTAARARALFLASLAYLPLLWGLLVAERAPRAAARSRPRNPSWT